MDYELAQQTRLRNFLHSLLLLSGMVLLLAGVGSIFGMAGMTVATVAGVALVSAGSRVSPHWILKLHRARFLEPAAAPGLYRRVRDLARRAELPGPPAIYLVPSAVMNAFAVGNARRAAIALTDGLVRRLDSRELSAVLAHELSHVAHRDLWVMGLADLITRFTHVLSMVGQLLLLLSLPRIVTGQAGMPWLPLLLLVLAPSLSALLQLALSRTREFAADLKAAELTGDPDALASALTKLEAQNGGWLRRILFPIARRDGSPLLRSHPATAERIARLRALAPRPNPLRALFGDFGLAPVRIVPARRWPGTLLP